MTSRLGCQEFSSHPITKQLVKILVILPVTLPTNFRRIVDPFYDQWEMLRNGTLESLRDLGQASQRLWVFSGTLQQQWLENKAIGIDILRFPFPFIPTSSALQRAGTLLVHWLSSPRVSSKRSSQGMDYISVFQS